MPASAAPDRKDRRLIAKTDVADVSSAFAMEQIVCASELPLNYVEDGKE